MHVRIVVDSTADFPEEFQNQLEIVPLTVHFGDEEYMDGVTIDRRTFYEKLSHSPVLPTTSQAVPEDFQTVFRQAHGRGEQVVAICISSKLSGTCQSAMIAAQDYPGEVFVVDSQTVAIGAGILAAHAISLANAGVDASTIARRLTELRDRVRIVAVLDTLEYLKKGGRISKTAAFAGELLSIKPVIGVLDGQVTLLHKARGVRQGMDALLNLVAKEGGVDDTMPAMLGYTGTTDALLQKFIADCASREDPIAKLPAACIGSTVGTHVGPGAYAIAFFRA